MQNLSGKAREFKLDKKTRIILVATGAVFIILISLFTVLIENYKKEELSPVLSVREETKEADVRVTPEPALMQPVVQGQALQESEKKEPLPGEPAAKEVPEEEIEVEPRAQGPLLY